MSNVIDQKVVQMQFDNKQFEQNVATTMGSVEKLKQSLNFNSTSKELENFSYTVGLSIKDIKNKMWSLIEYDIAGKLKNKFMEVTKALTVQPISAGFNEYELKMGSIQTIMASTGEDLETVNKYLGELNEYSDKTIYSFQDMTSNIGKFTNAGINLKDSVAAIKGVANVAAVSGANANEASRAMYNFSQALSSGYVKLIDWKSIENANMATVEFKNQLLDTAVAEGKLTKTSDGMYKTLKGTTISATKMFNDSLQEQWLTSEVLTKTLGKYADETTEIGKKAAKAATEVKTLSQLYDTLKESAQSGWAQTWEIIVGDFDEAKKFLAELNDLIGGMIGKSAEARNSLLENWKALGGRDELIESFRAMVDAITSIVKPIKEAFGEVFSPLTSDGLYAFTVGLKEFFQSLILTENAANNLKRVFKGIFSFFSIGVEIFKGLWEALGIVSDGATDLGGGLLEVLAIIGDMITAVADFIKETKIIRNIFVVIGKAIKLVFSLAGKLIGIFTGAFESGPLEVFNGLLENLAEMLDSIGGSASDFGESFKNAIKNLGSTFQNSLFFKTISALWEGIKSIASGVIKVISGIFKGIGNAFAAGDIQGAFEIINTILDGGVLVGITVIIKKIIDLFKAPEGILKSIKDIFDSLSGCLKSFTQNVQAQALKTIATAILILTGSLIALTFVDKNKLDDALAAITLAFGELLLIFTLMQKIASKGGAVASIKDSVGSLSSIIGMMIGLLAISYVIQKIGSLDWGTWGRGLLGITIVLGAVAGYQVMLEHLVEDGTKAQKGIKLVKNLAFSLLIISIPLRIIGAMDWASWGRGLMGVTVLLAALGGVQIMMSHLVKGYKKVQDGAKAMRSMAITLLMIAIPMSIIGNMEWETWGKGLIGVTVLLAALAGVEIMFTKLAGGGKKILQGAASMMIMAAAINMLVPSLVILGVLPTEKLIQGGVSIIAILATLAGAQIMLTKLAGAGAKMLQGAASVAILAASIGMIIPPLLTLGLMPTTMLIQGALGIVGVLASLAGAQIMLTKLAGAGKKMIQGAASVAILAACISMVIPPILILGMMPIETLLKGVIGFATILAALAGTQIMMTKLAGGGQKMIQGAASMVIMAAAIDLLVPALIALSLVPAILLAKSLGAVAIAMVIFGKAAMTLTPVAGTLLTVGAAIALFGVGVVAIGGGLILMGTGLKVLSVGLIAFVGALGVALGAAGLLIPGIVKAVGAIIVAILDVIIQSGPKIAEALIVVVFALCDTLMECVPKIVETVLVIITELLASLAEYVPQIVGSLLDLLVGVIQELVNKLPDVFKAIKLDPASIQALFESVMMLGAVMVVAAGFKHLGKAALVGVLYMAAVIAELTLVLAAIGALNKIPGLQDFIESGGNLLQAIGTAIGQFVGGIVGGFAAGATSTLPEVGKNLSDFMSNAQAFIDGVKQVDKSVLNGTATLVGVVLALTAASILEGLTSWTKIFTGGSSLSSFGDELVAFAPKIKQYADTVAGIDGAAVEASANAAKCLSELAHNLPNSGGLLGKITGENDIGTFGEQLIPFGEGLLGYSQAVSGIDADAINSSVSAAKGLVALSEAIPNTGGLVSFFSGDNRMDLFGVQLVLFGRGIKQFSEEVSGLVDDGSITASIEVAKALVELSNNIPNEGGVAAWFAGENSIASFAGQLVDLGRGIKNFANEIVGVEPTAIAAAATAGKALAEMTNCIPNQGGVVAWFTGENSIATFADSLPLLGQGLKGFAMATAGIVPETVTAAAQVAKTLAEMTATIPNEGGVAAWFAGESSVSKFGSDLTSLGQGIKGFSEAVVGINTESVSAAASAAKDLAAMVAVIPSEGGIKAWFAGETSVSKFASEMPKLGEGLAGFSTSVAEINGEKITAGANAAKSLAEMTKHIPSEGGIKAWFSGKTSISSFADKLPALGKGLTGFSTELEGINPENVTAGANAAKTLAQMAETTPKNSDKIVTFGTNLKTFGGKLKEYFDATKGITAESTSAASKALDQVKEIANVNSGNIKSVADAITKLTKAIKQMATDIKDDLKNAGKEAIEAFISGIDGKLSAAKKACQSVLDACVEAMSGKASSFESAGKAVVTGFCSGITQNTYKAEAKAAAMAQAAYEAARKQLDVNSPSKIFRSLGTSVPEGFAMGISKFGNLVEGSTADMTDSAINGVKDSISKLSTVINSDIDAQPTIRPVLDLSDIRSGAGLINGMFAGNSIGVNANVGAISSAMSRYNQNGTNDDVVSAIDLLRKELKDKEYSSYSIGNVTVNGDAEVEEAFNSIIRAVTIARRT